MAASFASLKLCRFRLAASVPPIEHRAGRHIDAALCLRRSSTANKSVKPSGRSSVFCLRSRSRPPAYLGRSPSQPHRRNEPHANCALLTLPPFDPVSRDRLSPIGSRSARLQLIGFRPIELHARDCIAILQNCRESNRIREAAFLRTTLMKADACSQKVSFIRSSMGPRFQKC